MALPGLGSGLKGIQWWKFIPASSVPSRFLCPELFCHTPDFVLIIPGGCCQGQALGRMLRLSKAQDRCVRVVIWFLTNATACRKPTGPAGRFGERLEWKQGPHNQGHWEGQQGLAFTQGVRYSPETDTCQTAILLAS